MKTDEDSRRGNRSLQFARFVVVIAAILFASVLPASPASAQGQTNVVINEVFYHPPCDVNYSPCPDALAEFIEIYNPNDRYIDVAGWQFDDGINYTFPAGSILPAVGYLVIADDMAGFNDYFDRNASGQWTGELSNSGERIALIDADGALIDTLTYSDGSDTPGAWSVGADGSGDSLSLLSAADDDGRSFWWDAADPTPTTQNANAGQAPTAVVDNFVWSVLPAAHESIQVSADVYDGQNVSMQYRINYPGSNVAIPMTRGHGNNWTAEIPASVYQAGDLVRFRILNDGNRVAPRQNDTIKWVGTTIANPAVDTDLPVFEWFTSTANYNAGFSESGSTMQDGVLAYNGVVYDNIGFRARGKVARTSEWTKRNWKFKMPDHHKLLVDGISYGLDSMDLQGGFADESRIREFVGHTIADQMGLVASQVQHVRVQLNGNFFGLHTLQEHPEGGFLSDNDLDNATLFQGVSSPTYQSGPTGVSATTSITYENWDIPDYINMLAAASIIQNNDYAHSNFYFWFDADEHERYEGMVWDLDLSQGIRYTPTDGLTVRLENGTAWSFLWYRWKNQAPMFNQALRAPFRELYLRRLRTLADEWYGTGRYAAFVHSTYATISDEWVLDTARWGFWGGQRFTQQQAVDRYATSWINQYYGHINAGGPNGDIPAAQTNSPNLHLVVNAGPADHRNEHIRIVNNENTAIDVSGWRLSGSTTAVLPAGSVLPGAGSAYVVANDRKAGFRSVTANLYVLGEYDAPLHDADGAVELSKPNGQVIASSAWGVGAPSSGLILNEWNAVSSSNFLLGGDTRLGSIPGNGGDWYELVVTEDHLDIRNWRMDIIDSGTIDTTLAFTNDELWSDLRAGTIITVAENDIADADGDRFAEDVSYNPGRGDWWINVVSGTAGSGNYVTASDFRVSNDDWQIAIFDELDVRRFGPAGEGIGSLASGGVNGTQVGELEQDPGPDVTASSAYGDGDESTFGLANNFANRAQDFSALRPEIEIPATIGDVNCSDTADVLDSMIIAQYEVGLRTETGQCPLDDPSSELNATNGDLTNDGETNVLDALLISRCSVGIKDERCPPEPVLNG